MPKVVINTKEAPDDLERFGDVLKQHGFHVPFHALAVFSQLIGLMFAVTGIVHCIISSRCLVYIL